MDNNTMLQWSIVSAFRYAVRKQHDRYATHSRYGSTEQAWTRSPPEVPQVAFISIWGEAQSKTDGLVTSWLMNGFALRTRLLYALPTWSEYTEI